MIDAFIFPSAPRSQALQAAGQPVPPAVRGKFLIDTGASGTCIDPQLLAPLNLNPTGKVGVHTPSTNGTAHQLNQYDVQLLIPAPNGQVPFIIPALPIMESSFAAQGISGLIGRDVLAKCVLVYNGPISLYTLTY
ncbi:aspartyl protease family protein [Cupriavidus necator]